MDIQQRAGFTLLDLIISLGIVGLLFSFVVFNFRAGDSQRNIDDATQKFISDVRSVRLMALGGKQLAGGGFPVGGYGVVLETCSMDCVLRVVADSNGDGEADEIVAEYALSDNYSITDIASTAQAISDSRWLSLKDQVISIFYTHDAGILYVDNVISNDNHLRVTLSSSDMSEQRQVIISPSVGFIGEL